MLIGAQFDDFATALYKDSSFKNRLIVSTLLLLVLPSALLIALGVPEEPTYLVMTTMIFPLAIGQYIYRRRQLLPGERRKSHPQNPMSERENRAEPLERRDPPLHADSR